MAGFSLANDQFSSHQAGPVRKPPRSNRCLPLLSRYERGSWKFVPRVTHLCIVKNHNHRGTTFAWLLHPLPNGSLVTLLQHSTWGPPFSAQKMKDVRNDVPASKATSDTKVRRTMPSGHLTFNLPRPPSPLASLPVFVHNSFLFRSLRSLFDHSIFLSTCAVHGLESFLSNIFISSREQVFSKSSIFHSFFSVNRTHIHHPS